MTWPASRISIAAGAAANTHRSGLARLMASLTGAGSGPAATTAQPQKPAGAKPTTPDLTARAMRLHNRSKQGAQAYLRVHNILSRGA